ncbi:BspA family leucine-rich repeat surface protein [Planktomarina sp.]|uniref:BspA family leucine-rich repeat surface protein n=1 Tax=Planktomarina sp. TaxID=2024851 RepID=UPI00352FFB2B
MSGWDTSAVTNMFGMFSGASAFNQDISQWQTSNVTDMFYVLWCLMPSIKIQPMENLQCDDMSMFYQAFNQDISKWVTSKVTDMSGMFYGASAFNQDISNWTSSVTEYVCNVFWCLSLQSRYQPMGHLRCDEYGKNVRERRGL